MTVPVLPTLDAYVAHYAARTPHREAAVFGATRLTYADLDCRVAALAAMLRYDGLKPGDRVGVLSTPRPEYFVLLNAILRAGGIYVGLNPRHTAPEIAHAIGLTQPARIFALDHAFGLCLPEILAEAAAIAGCHPPVHSFHSLDDLDIGCGPGVARSECCPDDPAVIVFTSGTTGRPKGATLHHSGLIHAAIAQWEYMAVDRQRILNNLPINHVGCILNLSYGSIVGGGTIVFQQKFDPAQTLALIEEERVSAWLQVPTMFQMVVSHPDYARRDLSSLKAICAGGGALPMPTLSALRRIGARIYVEYGQTEVMSTIAFSHHGAGDDVLTATIGRFNPEFRVRIADAENRACAPGDVGEIQATGDCVMKGYWNDPIATAAAFTSDGWLKTGDLAMARPDGLVELKGRMTEMIKSGGYNLYPREIEMALEAHEAVAAAVIVGLPDEVFGEAAHAIVSLRPGRVVGSADLKIWCSHQLANYKIPKSFRRLDDLPRLQNGKIDRGGLNAIAASLPTLPQ